ncbi:MAG: FeoC-like transcriptional regulator [Gammaproteobacteria bacterium]|nr:FeoC-like transcriptional regulator [Gammaproteobacteria bacterium]
MILTEIKRYVQNRKQVSVQDVARHFDMEADAARGMLGFWVNKGKLKKSVLASTCANQCACDIQEQTEIYEWNAEFNGISIEPR